MVAVESMKQLWDAKRIDWNKNPTFYIHLEENKGKKRLIQNSIHSFQFRYEITEMDFCPPEVAFNENIDKRFVNGDGITTEKLIGCFNCMQQWPDRLCLTDGVTDLHSTIVWQIAPVVELRVPRFQCLSHNMGNQVLNIYYNALQPMTKNNIF